MPTEKQVGLANTLKVNLVQQPSKYLGVQFKLRGYRVADFQFLIDKLQVKLQGWKMKLLSQAVRPTLIAYVLQSLPLYSFSYFKVPNSVCSKMDSIIRASWWGHDHGEKKVHLINLDKISQRKKLGGLGIKKFKYMNQCMLNKQYWRICQNPQSLLAKTVKARYFPACSIQEYRAKPHHSWVWRNIIKQEGPFLREGKWRVVNGYNTPLNH